MPVACLHTSSCFIKLPLPCASTRSQEISRAISPDYMLTVCYLLQNATLAEKALRNKVNKLEAKLQNTQEGIAELHQAMTKPSM